MRAAGRSSRPRRCAGCARTPEPARAPGPAAPEDFHPVRPAGAFGATRAPPRPGATADDGHGTARAVAALYGVFAGRGAYGGHRVLSPGAAERVREGQGACRDLVIGAGFGGEREAGLGPWLSGRTVRTGPTRAPSGTTGPAGRRTRRPACPPAT